MEFAQRRVLQVQAILIVLTLFKFFIPYGEILEFDSYFISTPYAFIYMLITLGGLVLGLILNAKNDASFKSAYFVGSLFFPLLWGLNMVVEFFDLLILYDFYLPAHLINGFISFVLVGIYLFYAIYYNDPLDWTSHKVDKFSIQIKKDLYIILGFITFVFFVTNLLLKEFYFANDFSDTFHVIAYSNFTIPFVWFLLLWGALVGSLNSSYFVIFRDRLYFFTALAFTMLTTLFAFNIFEIVRVFTNLLESNFTGLPEDGFLLLYTVVLYFVFPIFLILSSYLFHQKNKMNLVPYAPRNNNLTMSNRYDSMKDSTSETRNDADIITDGYNDHENTSSTFQSGLHQSAAFNTIINGVGFTRTKLFMVFVHFVVLVIFIVGFGSNVYSISSFGESASFTFGELSELIEFIEAFGGDSDLSFLIGFYIFIIFGLQVGLLILQVRLKPSFKNNGFIGLIVIQVVHFLVLIYGLILVGNSVNDLNDIFSNFGASIDYGIGFGFVVQFLIVVLGVFIYAQGDNYLPQIFESINNLDLSFTSSLQNANRSQSSRPAPRPAPSPGSRPAPRLEPVPGSRPGRSAPRPNPATSSRPVMTPASSVTQETSIISALESNLAALKRLLDEGLITEVEYNAKKKEQLDKL